MLAARDPQTQVNALQKGEIDMIERVPFEQIGRCAPTRASTSW
jgi:hypothetical protein